MSRVFSRVGMKIRRDKLLALPARRRHSAGDSSLTWMV